MLIHRIDADTLAQAERLGRELAERLAAARGEPFSDEDEAEAFLWEIVALMQQQAAITARILTTAIDVKNGRRGPAD